jgi:hypothetical protein
MEGGPRDNIDPYTGRAKPNNNRRANDNKQGKKTQGRDQGNRYNPYSLSTLRGRNDSLDQSGEGGDDLFCPLNFFRSQACCYFPYHSKFSSLHCLFELLVRN